MKNKQNIYFLEELYSVIQDRAKGSKKNSYTKSLLKKGKNKLLIKIYNGGGPWGFRADLSGKEPKSWQVV